eukprot:TRINITY_DN4124_c0_g1_i2.p1 TRINITY_DN4124_c0_g1~~TRINITY_DN4124_c0_g1_i2.p1  ORF type:complete len:358 (-),score=89.02 TRINITY_DN4124_c0_g1_i2:106-1179(-)
MCIRDRYQRRVHGEIIMYDNCSVVSNVVGISFYQRYNAEEIQLSQPPREPVRIFFPTDPRLEGTVHCAWYNPLQRVFDTGACKTEEELAARVECICSKVGDYALVVKNARPPSKGFRPNSGLNRPVIPRAHPPAFLKEPHYISSNPHPSEPVPPRRIHPVFWLVLMLILWILTMIAFQKDGEENEPFTEQLTVHPVYSALFVNSSTIPKIVRVHLLFLTIVVQLSSEAFFLHKESSSALAFTGLAVSFPLNYVFGCLARLLTARDKPFGKTIFVFVAEVVGILLFVVSEGKLQQHSHEEVSIFVTAFLLGLFLDLLVLDFLMAIIVKFEIVRTLVRFRGFFTDAGVVNEHIAYRLIE